MGFDVVASSHAVQGDLWWALRGSLRLAGTALPGPTFAFDQVFDQGLTHVVSLTGNPLTACFPMTASAHALQDLHGEPAPADPTFEWNAVAHAAAAVRDLLDQQHGVLVHCIGGTGRTGTVIGAVLMSYGMKHDDVAAWLDAVHQLRGQPGWPECPWQYDALRVLTT